MNKFTWGKILNKFEYDFDGKIVEIIKYHPWIVENCIIKKSVPNYKQTHYHCEILHESFTSLQAALIGWIAYDNLGNNQHALVSGICRSLTIFT